MRATLFAAILTIGAARLASAEKAPPVRIALLAATPDDPLAGRIEAELRALGFQVERSAISPDLPIDELVRQQIAGGARAAVVADGHRTDVWIAAASVDRVGLRQELEVEESSGLQSVLALRTVEFLRISLGPGRRTAGAGGHRGSRRERLAPAPPPEHDGGGGARRVVGGAGQRRRGGAVRDRRRQLARPIVAASGAGGLRVRAAPLVRRCRTRTNQARATVWLAGGGLLVAPRDTTARRLSGEAGAGALAAMVRATGMVAACR